MLIFQDRQLLLTSKVSQRDKTAATVACVWQKGLYGTIDEGRTRDRLLIHVGKRHANHYTTIVHDDQLAIPKPVQWIWATARVAQNPQKLDDEACRQHRRRMCKFCAAGQSPLQRDPEERTSGSTRRRSTITDCPRLSVRHSRHRRVSPRRSASFQTSKVVVRSTAATPDCVSAFDLMAVSRARQL